MWNWLKRGEWLDHPCRCPDLGLGSIGDRWQCKCGRIWQIGNDGKTYLTRYWYEVKSINVTETEEFGAKSKEADKT